MRRCWFVIPTGAGGHPPLVPGPAHKKSVVTQALFDIVESEKGEPVFGQFGKGTKYRLYGRDRMDLGAT
jgi:hypothetical protein